MNAVTSYHVQYDLPRFRSLAGSPDKSSTIVAGFFSGTPSNYVSIQREYHERTVYNLHEGWILIAPAKQADSPSARQSCVIMNKGRVIAVFTGATGSPR